jgi:uncharacterized protein (TIGR04255 family)
MEIHNILQPISNGHSIKEANIAVFLDKPIDKLEAFESLKSSFPTLFNEYNLIGTKKLQLNLEKKDARVVDMEGPTGFSLELRDENNRPIRILQGRNDENRLFFSYHTLNYEGWSTFLENFLRIMHAIVEIQDEVYTSGYSLNYVDEFIWLKDEVNYDFIFYKESRHIPRGLFDSFTFNYSWIKENEVNDISYYDRLDISTFITDDHPVTRISHNATRMMERSQELSSLIDSKDLTSLLGHAHDCNKSMLKELLTKEVQKLIKLI